MKTLKHLLVMVAVLLGLSSSLSAQITMTSTTLSTAVTSTSGTTVVVASATGISAGRFLFIDREFMKVVSVSGTTISVVRGVSGIVSTHASGATVYLGPGSYFINYDHAGSCTATNELVLPQINVRSGNIWQCTSSVWVVLAGPAGSATSLTALTPSAAATVDVGAATNAFRTAFLTSLINFEGSTVDAFETVFSVTDPAVDVTITVPSIASGAATLGQVEVTFADHPTGNATDRTFFVATHGYIISACSQIHSVAQGGAATLQVVKDTGTTAPGAGTDTLTAAFDLNATANTVQAKTSGDFVSLAARTLATGDRLSVDYSAAIGSTAGNTVTCSLIPN